MSYHITKSIILHKSNNHKTKNRLTIFTYKLGLINIFQSNNHHILTPFFQENNILYTTLLDKNNRYYLTDYELIQSTYLDISATKKKFFALNSLNTIIYYILPENEINIILYSLFEKFICNINNNQDWILDYLSLELEILKASGFALELEKCSITGQTENLLFISPKTGKALSYKTNNTSLLYYPKIFTLLHHRHKQPNYLYSNQMIYHALVTIRFFLQKYIFIPNDITFPKNRLFFEKLFSKFYKI